MLYALIAILVQVSWIVQVAVIIQFILSLLIAFNVVNNSNRFVDAVWTALNAILDPILRPIRKIMPDTRPLDLSPMVLIFGLWVIQMLLLGLARDLAA